MSPEQILERMAPNDLALVSLLADMGNGEVRDASRDLPRVTGKDDPLSRPGRILHWDAEWHFDPKGVTFERKVIGGHIIALGLTSAETRFAEYTSPVFQWVKDHGGLGGFAHFQYLSDEVAQSLDCCKPLEYPVEIALGSSSFLMEDVNGGESAIRAYYRLLNCGFRPGLAAATDFPCNRGELPGTLLTYVRIPGGKLTYRGWVDGIAAGRTVVSRNAHREFLDLRVNGSNGPGSEIALTRGGSVDVRLKWMATAALTGAIELVQNGIVVAKESRFVEMHKRLEFPRSGWLCARRMDANGHQVHTAAVFVSVNGAPVRASARDAAYFIDYLDELLRKTSTGGPWNVYYHDDLAAAQERYWRAREVFRTIREASPPE